MAARPLSCSENPVKPCGMRRSSSDSEAVTVARRRGATGESFVVDGRVLEMEEDEYTVVARMLTSGVVETKAEVFIVKVELDNEILEADGEGRFNVVMPWRLGWGVSRSCFYYQMLPPTIFVLTCIQNYLVAPTRGTF